MTIDTESPLYALIQKLERKVKERIRLRQTIEERWIEDLHQFHGVEYARKGRADALNDQGESRITINMTRAKSNTMEAKLVDLLFPTDDRNWGIDPTPVPELAREATQSAEIATQKQIELATLIEQQKDEPDNEALANEVDQETRASEAADAVAQEFADIIDEARKRADRMEDEIDDVFTECRYAEEARKVIRNGVRIGCGVIEGPMAQSSGPMKWEKDDAGVWAFAAQDLERPKYRAVDPWHFFPDMEVADVREGEGVFVRELKSKTGLRAMAKTPGFDREGLKLLISLEPAEGVPGYLTRLTDITGATTRNLKGMYQVWKYTGPVSGSDLMLLAEGIGDEGDVEIAKEMDELDSVDIVLWFCQGIPLKFGIYPLESNEPLYSVFSMEEDEETPFGYGIPRIMRDEQRALTAAWRMLMDNSGLSTGPQIVVDTSQIEPVDGSWELTPRKMWKWNSAKEMEGRRTPFDSFEIPSNQVELANLIGLILKTIDEVTGLPTILQGDQGTQPVQTATGMTLLMNSANIVFRQIVRSFDDNITTPVVRRCYHWLMQFSDREEIKGDYAVAARGTSALLQRETEAQNLLMIADRMGDHPVYGQRINHDALLKRIFRAHMLPDREMIKTEDEVKANQAQMGPDPAVAVQQRANELKEADIRSRISIAEQENDRHIRVAEASLREAALKHSADRDLSMEKIAAELNKISLQEEARKEVEKMKQDGADRRIAVEAQSAAATGEHAGGAI